MAWGAAVADGAPYARVEGKIGSTGINDSAPV
jgi:hypothetical protein